MVTITSNCNDTNRVGLVKMNGSKEAGFTVGGISDSSKTAFKEAILDNMINLGKEKTYATGQQRQSVQMTIEAEDEGIYSPVFINETTDQIFTAFFASTGEDYAHIRNLGSNYFCYEDTADAMRSDWDFNDVTMQVEIM